MLQAVNRSLEDAALDLVAGELRAAKRPMLTTKFGPESAVLLHLVGRLRAAVPVVWVDNGYNTRDTLRYASELVARLSLNLRTYHPAGPALEAVPALDDPRHAEFTRRVKLEPFQRAIDEIRPDLWITALRREQTAHRAGQPQIRQTPHGYRKLAPLLDWSRDDMRDYLRHHDLPAGPEVYDPTKGEARRECGLHLVF